ncbi:MAG: DUF3089 domain-containing protein [Actinomycetota bacterium]
MKRLASVLVTVGFVLASCGGDDSSSADSSSAESTVLPSAAPSTDAPTTEPAATEPISVIGEYTSETYGDLAHWTCHPDTDDTCDDDTSVTLVNADGTTEVLPFAPVPDAPVDCFYLYPTSSEDQTFNSDLIAGREREVAFEQAARLSSVCRMFAPTYRSVTLAALFGLVPGDRATGWQMPYDDVVDAWKHYLANYNDGRGVILLGHSQGTGQLGRLLENVIDPDPAQSDLIVSAILLGGSVAVPQDEAVGGDLKNIPVCTDATEFGCVMTYATFRSTAPPPANSYFGRAARMGEPEVPGQEAACTNPAALGGGQGELISAFRTAEWAYTDGSGLTQITTPFVGFPGLLTGECVRRDSFHYLEVTVNGDPADARADDIRGDLSAEWGLHAVDWEVAALSILDVVDSQIAGWLGAR